MRILHFDCPMGAAGDMISAALLELTGNISQNVELLNNLGLPGIKYEAEATNKCGQIGTHLKITYNDVEEDADTLNGNHHSTSKDIFKIINDSNLPDKAKKDACAIYESIAAAESKIHGVPVTDIHFHEVGTMDAIADVSAACFLINSLNPDIITSSPVCTGFGNVKCAHGILPVPAPATAELLKEIPTYTGRIEGEMCTPTGAAIITYFSNSFCEMPKSDNSLIGYGMGKRNYTEAPNCVYAWIESTNTITEFEMNIDDMTPEDVGFAVDTLLKEGALDVFTQPIYMKKNRPAVKLTCLCLNKDRDKIVGLIFKHTTTIGIRESICSRYILRRNEEIISTNWGNVRNKISEGYGSEKSKLEYEDLSKIATENNLSIEYVRKNIYGG